jgi:putative Mg2+ transporter-C (MgtC) family protein
MTGIGFLGAGVIFKEGLTVRGLTTAASVWVTAAIGVLIGIGFYFPASITTVLVIFVPSAFRWVESRMPTQSYARLDLAYPRDRVMDESATSRRIKHAGPPPAWSQTHIDHVGPPPHTGSPRKRL